MEIFFASLTAVLVGIAFCFYGYRVFLVLLPIWGFFAGFWLGAEAITWLFGTGFLSTVTGWIVGFLVGLSGAILSYLFYLVGVAFVAGSIGAALGSGLMAAFGLDGGFLVALVAIIVAVAFALVVLIFNVQKFVIVALTAFAGANLLVAGGLLFFRRIPLDELRNAGNAIAPVLQDSWFWSLAWIVLAVIGLVVQLQVHRSYEFSPERYQEGWG